MTYGADAQRLDKKLIDGAVCGAIYRRISGPLSERIAPYVTGNAVTLSDFIVGLFAAACLMAGFDLAGVILIQLFSVLSCTDGEVARLRGQTSRLGDYFDTMVDRSVELVLVLAIISRLAAVGAADRAYLTGLALVGGIFLITASAAKFRSTFGRDYPKRRLERAFSWVSAGSDARLAVMSLGVLLQAVSGSPHFLSITLQLLCACVYANLIARLFIIWSRTRNDGRFEV